MAVVVTMIAGAATTAAVTGAVVAGITIGAVTAAMIGAVVSAVVGSALISKPSTGNFNSKAQNSLINKKANNAPIPVIYGTRRVGGTIVFMDTKVNQLFLNLVVSEGEIEGYLAFYFFDELADSKFAPFQIDPFFGSESQEANDFLTGHFNYYTSEHRLAGTAYLTFALTFNPDVFPSGRPVINALVKGIKTFDPRASIFQWTENPILCIRDYLTNARYGRGIDPSLIDDPSFTLAANYCDEQVAYDGVNLIKRYTCNGLVETQNNSLNIIRELLSSCRGVLIFSGGVYKIIIDKPEVAVFTFSEENIIGGWKIKLGDKNSKFNRIRANFFNKSKDYQADIAVVDNSDLRVLDNGLLERMIDLPFTSDIIRAKAIAFLNLNQSRYSITCEFTSTIEALRVEVGDVVYINHKTPGWDTHNSNLGKKFRIMRVTLQNNDEVRILANEYADDVYDLEAIEVIEPSALIEIGDLSTCLPPTNLRVNRGNSRMYARWDSSLDPYVVGYIVRFRVPRISNDWTETAISALTYYEWLWLDRDSAEFSVRAVNSIGTKSEWLT